MKRAVFILLALCLPPGAIADEANWLTSFPDAADQASREHKLVLLDFTGSDWCGWCMRLDAETFSRPAFIGYAGRNLVLVKVDFPEHKSLPDDVRQANHALKNKYDVSGFPTVMIVKPDGKVLWDQRGYVPGGPGLMINAANQCLKAAGLVSTPPPPAATATAAPPKPAAPANPVWYRQPAPPPRNPGDEPKLQGILYSASHSSAVLDGTTCEEGDTVHGARVVKIARDNVTVEYQGQTRVLRLAGAQGEIRLEKAN